MGNKGSGVKKVFELPIKNHDSKTADEHIHWLTFVKIVDLTQLRALFLITIRPFCQH
jgi:hypothetical protein